MASDWKNPKIRQVSSPVLDELIEDYEMSRPADLIQQGPPAEVERPGAIYWEKHGSFWYPQQEADAQFSKLEAEIRRLKAEETTDG